MILMSSEHTNMNPSLLAQHREQAKNLLQAFVTASSPEQRQSAHALALSVLDHHHTQLFDDLCTSGGVTLLTRCLQKALWTSVDSCTTAFYICDLIQLLLRCSNGCLTKVFYSIGADLLSVLLSTLYLCDEARPPTVTITLIERLASISPSLKATLKYDALLRSIQKEIRRHSEHSMEIVQVLFKLLASLSAHPESKLCVLRCAGLVNDVIDNARSVPGAYHVDIAKFFRNLVWEASCRGELHSMKGFLSLLVFFYEQNDNTTKLIVLEAWWYLALEKSFRHILFKCKEGEVTGNVVKAIYEKDLQTSALVVLARLLDQRVTAKVMKDDIRLIDHLTAVATGAVTQESCCTAAICLKRIATHTTIKDKHHATVIESLVQMGQCENAMVRCWAARAFGEQARRATSSFYLARTPEVVAAIVKLARDPCLLTRNAAVKTLVSLLSDTSNIKRFSKKPEILDILIENALDECCSGTYRRDAIQGLLAFVNHHSAKTRVAKHIGLVSSLSIFGISHDIDVELRKAAIHGVMVLAPLM